VRLMSRILEDSPLRRYQVISAYGGREGLDMVRLHQPDLVLLDLGLPDLDGYQVVQRMRSTPEWQHIPIIIVSAQDSVDEQRPLTGGMLIAKSEGLTPGEIVRWSHAVVDTTVSALPTPPTPKAALAL
jgi:CheY-like chemotaxis protein